MLREVREHRLEGAGINRRAGVVIEVDGEFHRVRTGLPLWCHRPRQGATSPDRTQPHPTRPNLTQPAPTSPNPPQPRPTSVFRLTGIDLIDPGEDAALQVLHVLEAVVTEEAGGTSAAHARLALADDLARGIELGEPLAPDRRAGSGSSPAMRLISYSCGSRTSSTNRSSPRSMLRLQLEHGHLEAVGGLLRSGRGSVWAGATPQNCS